MGSSHQAYAYEGSKIYNCFPNESDVYNESQSQITPQLLLAHNYIPLSGTSFKC